MELALVPGWVTEHHPWPDLRCIFFLSDPWVPSPKSQRGETTNVKMPGTDLEPEADVMQLCFYYTQVTKIEGVNSFTHTLYTPLILLGNQKIATLRSKEDYLAFLLPPPLSPFLEQAEIIHLVLILSGPLARLIYQVNLPVMCGERRHWFWDDFMMQMSDRNHILFVSKPKPISPLTRDLICRHIWENINIAFA